MEQARVPCAGFSDNGLPCSAMLSSLEILCRSCSVRHLSEPLTQAAGPHERRQALEDASRSVDYRRRRLAAMAPHSPESILERLAADSNHQVRMMVAANPDTPAHVIKTLCEDSDPHVKHHAMRHPSCAGQYDDITGISRNEQAALASNPSTDAAVLSRLANINDHDLQVRVAGNPSASPNTLRQLLRLQDSQIDEAVALNPARTAGTVAALSKTASEVAFGAAFRDPLMPGHVLRQYSGHARASTFIAQNPAITSEICEILYNCNSPAIDACLARNASVSPAVLERLHERVANPDNLNSRNRRQGKNIIANPNAPLSVLRHQVMRAESMRDFEALAVIAAHPGIDDLLAQPLMASRSTTVRAALGANPRLDVGYIRRLAKSQSAEVLKGVASNPSTPSDILSSLSECSNLSITRRVAANPNTEEEVVCLLAFGSEDNETRAAATMSLAARRDALGP